MSTRIGWGTLIVGMVTKMSIATKLTGDSLAGGGAYFFAKRSINADKKARHEADMKRRRLTESLELSSRASPPKEKRRKAIDHTSSPSTEASHDPAPTRHLLEGETQKAPEKPRYEASEPFRAKKGDRFS